MDCWLDFCSSVFACAAASNLLPLPCNHDSAHHLFMMSPFYHLFDRAQIFVSFTLASSTLLSVSWHGLAFRSRLSPVHSSPTWAVSLSSSFQSSSAASLSLFVMAARFHHMTSTAFSLLAENSQSITSWSEPVTWFPARMLQCMIGRVARDRSMVDSPSSQFLAKWWVARSSLPISSPYSSITYSHNFTSCCILHLGSHPRLCAFVSPTIIEAPPTRIALCPLSCNACRSPLCTSLWS